MRVAVIGAGFAGLATAYFLTEFENIDVCVFDRKHVGAGASGVACGLLHPYPGYMARRSHLAKEAMEVSKYLLNIAKNHTSKTVYTQKGIYRLSLNADQHERLLSHEETFRDIELKEGNKFLIKSGITVLSKHYLEGLTIAIKAKGGAFFFEEIKSLNQLEEFDHIVIAAGYGIKNFEECRFLNIKFLKGQTLRISGAPPYDRSLISKGYLAHMGTLQYFELGATYERNFDNSYSNLTEAKALLKEKLNPYRDREILDCKSGIRVCSKSHYLPIIEKINFKTTVFTALGSRGLLYHGIFGQSLANQIAQNVVIS